MENLISNGSHLYAYTKHLLRTPLTRTITLAPDERAWYAVAGAYSNAWPTTGWLQGNTASGSLMAGNHMRKAFLNPGTFSPDITKYQKWRQVTTSHDPEFVFYQGSYSISSNTPSSEAYMQLCGYHFTIPSKYANCEIVAASLAFTCGGSIVLYANSQGESTKCYFTKDAPTSIVPSGSAWKKTSYWTQRIGVFSTLDDPVDMYNSVSTTINISDGYSGNPRGTRDLWGKGSGYDGIIPVSSSPTVQTFALSTEMLSALRTNQNGWIVNIPAVAAAESVYSTDTTTNYPFFYNSASAAAGYWLCYSCWGFALNVTLTI